MRITSALSAVVPPVDGTIVRQRMPSLLRMAAAMTSRAARAPRAEMAPASSAARAHAPAVSSITCTCTR
eukprot:9422021-Alexandrium_andersonii.AAC.1